MGVTPILGMDAILARREPECINEEKKGGGRHGIVKWNSLVCHVKILWASEKQYVLWSITSGICNLINASPSTEGKALTTKVELVVSRISIRID